MATSTSFPQFQRLPTEIRLRIWKETWAEPRVIDITVGEYLTDYDENYQRGEYATLRSLCRWSIWLRENSTHIIVRDLDAKQGLGKCADPVALSVCRESRAHSLQSFISMPHWYLNKHMFFLNPQRDILWLSEDIADNPRVRDELLEHYSNQLRRMGNAFIDEEGWTTTSSVKAILNGCNNFHIAKIILRT